MQIAKIAIVVIVLGVVLYLIYTKMIKPKSIMPGEVFPGPGGVGTIMAQRQVGDANLCSWLNGTYPKLKTKQFDQIDGGRDNPQALKDWQANNCDLINY